MMNVLVTGGAGYIGSYTAKLLVKGGYSCTVLDNLDRGHEWAVKWCPLVKMDLSDEKGLVQLFQKNKIETVVHFAAHSCVGESIEKPDLYFKNNVVNTLHLLNAMKTAKVPHIVFSSTAATYGDPIEIPIPETHPQIPVNPYGDSKLFVEKMLHWYDVAYGLKWVALRYFNAAGADLDTEIGEDHSPETHLIPLVLQTLLGKRKEIKILGTDYPTPDGTAIRDYIHIVDLADAHIRAIDYLKQGKPSVALNLGTGKGYSVKEVIRIAEKVTGKKIPAVDAPRRAGDPASLIAKSDLAFKTLQWRPQYSSLEKIIETAWRWHQKHDAK